MPARPKPGLVIPARVPARLRWLVESSGKTQVEIAAEIGWSKQQLHRTITGPNPKIESVAAVLIATGNTWSALD